MKTALLFSLSLALPLAAQGAKGGKGKAAPAPAPQPAAAAPAPAPAQDPNDITIVKQVPYNPSVSREPFQVLGDSMRKDGGDYIDDIAVKGYTKREGKLLAVVSDSRGNVRTLEIGYKFKDGIIAAIDDKSVTFHQWDPNTSNQNVFKKVVKTFKREETKR